MSQPQMQMKPHVFLIAAACVSCSEPQGLGPVVPNSAVERQMIGLLQKFDRWDDDGSGKLDSAELTSGVESLRGKPQQVPYSAREIIEFYDKDGDGKVSIAEAQSGYSRSGEAKQRASH